MSTSGTVGDDDFIPLTVEEARALMTEAPAGVDRETLLVERAEAEAQLRAAEATLGVTSPAGTDSRPAGEQEREEPAQNPHIVDGEAEVVGALDVEALREAAASARAADEELARAASEAGRPVDTEPGAGAGSDPLGGAESAFVRALELREEEVPAAWRRLVGALISATGMAIVIGALGWNVYWLLVPIALIAVLTVDLRLAGRAARQASSEAAGELSAVGGGGADGLDRIRRQRAHAAEAEARLAAARAGQEAAYGRFEALAPGRHPSEVEEIVAEYEAGLAARKEAAAARAEAEARARAQAQAGAEAKPEPVVPPVSEPPATTEGVKAPAAAEWWFGTKEPPPVPATASAPVRALAERLSAEGREALARIEAQLAALERAELAKRSLEWHEKNGAAEPADGSPAANPT